MPEDDRTFTAWAGVAKGQPLQKMQLQLRAWDENAVELKVTHCGICGSDAHTLDEDWGPADFPCVPGHEIVDVVTHVGKNVTNVKPGDRAGVGAQSGSCHECDNYKWRGDYRFVFKIPDSLPSEVAATFFCAGVTAYAPLKRTNVGPNSVVGIMGVGGLGHYGILWAKAMGAKVIGMSHSEKKREVAGELGCDDYIVTSDDEQMAKYKNKMTHILCTGTTDDFVWERYLSLIKVGGHFINVMHQSWDFPKIDPFLLIMKQVYITGSAIGSPSIIRDMLEFAVEHKVRPWIQVYPMKHVQTAIDDFKAGKPRFRFVLEN